MPQSATRARARARALLAVRAILSCVRARERAASLKCSLHLHDVFCAYASNAQFSGLPPSLASLPPKPLPYHTYA
eukprot:6173159-Pleurochrysis_carterae.AAC.3